MLCLPGLRAAVIRVLRQRLFAIVNGVACRRVNHFLVVPIVVSINHASFLHEPAETIGHVVSHSLLDERLPRSLTLPFRVQARTNDQLIFNYDIYMPDRGATVGTWFPIRLRRRFVLQRAAAIATLYDHAIGAHP